MASSTAPKMGIFFKLYLQVCKLKLKLKTHSTVIKFLFYLFSLTNDFRFSMSFTSGSCSESIYLVDHSFSY
jgi:hypothetical protein